MQSPSNIFYIFAYSLYGKKYQEQTLQLNFKEICKIITNIWPFDPLLRTPWWSDETINVVLHNFVIWLKFNFFFHLGSKWLSPIRAEQSGTVLSFKVSFQEVWNSNSWFELSCNLHPGSKGYFRIVTFLLYIYVWASHFLVRASGL